MAWFTDENGKRKWGDVDGDGSGFRISFDPQCCTCKKVFDCPVTMMSCYRNNLILCSDRIPKNPSNDYLYPPTVRSWEFDEIREEAKLYPPDLQRRTLDALKKLEENAS